MSSGTIATSSADVLWQANQHLIETLQTQNDRKDMENARLIEQRDRLVGLMDERVAPALEGIAKAQQRDGAILEANSRMLATLLAATGEGGDRHAPAPHAEGS